MNIIIVWRKLRGTSKIEKVEQFFSVEQADEYINQHNEPTGGWIYFREPTAEELNDNCNKD